MTIALICPANLSYMPYLQNYKKILDLCQQDYVIINWDRLGIEDVSELTYRDRKQGISRNFWDYQKYYGFVRGVLGKYRYEKVILFGLQLGFFFNKVLLNDYQGRYIFDIRDFNPIARYWSPKNIVRQSFKTVISSPGYLEWLPTSDNYVVNHNTTVTTLEELHPVDVNLQDNIMKISLIGSLRDTNVNIELLDSLKNHEQVNVYYHGYGPASDELMSYVQNHGIKNAFFTGRYERDSEAGFYLASSLINGLRFADCINNRTALPNRLYNAPMYGKPILAYKGTYLASEIHRYNLGVVLDSFENTFDDLGIFFKQFNSELFDDGRRQFFTKVIDDNNEFEKVLHSFFEVRTKCGENSDV